MLLALVLVLSVHAASSGPVPDVTRLQPRPFAFRISFWNNLHHFLYVLGRARNGEPDARRRAVANAPKDVEGLSARSDAERAAWDEAVAFYDGGLSKKDAVFDTDLIRVTQALASAPETSDLSGLGLDAGLVATLQKVAPIYRAVWWPRHQRADAARRDGLQSLIDQHGDALVKRLTAVYHTRWPSQPRTIDLAAYTNWAGAYSTDGGLIVVASTDPEQDGPLGLESLLHESSHQWDEEIGSRLSAIAAKVGRPLPPDLSHALIFYTSGEIVGEAFHDYVPYAVKNDLWYHSGLRPLKPLLDQYWRPYIRGSGTFDDAIAQVLTHLP
jgi:hypothetical protein